MYNYLINFRPVLHGDPFAAWFPKRALSSLIVASIPIYGWQQMRHGQFWGESIKSLILSFNIQQYEFCAQI